MSLSTELPDLDKLEAYATSSKNGDWHATEAMLNMLDEDDVLALVAAARRAKPEGEAPQAEQVRNDALEEAAKMLLNGYFLHDTAPPKLFANEAAKAIREMKRVAPAAQHAESGAQAGEYCDHPAFLKVMDDILTPQGMAKFNADEDVNLNREFAGAIFMAGLAAQSQGAHAAHPGLMAEIECLNHRIAVMKNELKMRHDKDAGDVWYWQGDGSDDPASMSLSMSVVINAADLRAALAAKVEAPAAQQAAAPGALAEYVPGRWFEARTLDEMQAFYLSRLPAIRDAAKEHGYAVGLHGSQRRDFDLIAMQWRDDAVDKDTLARAIADAACGIRREGAYDWEAKPSNRVATSIPVCWTVHDNPDFDKPSVGHIDLSVIDHLAPSAPGTPEAPTHCDPAEGFCAACREQESAGSAEAPPEPFMYAISTPSGKAYFDEHCVDTDPGVLQEEVAIMNQLHGVEYRVVPVYTRAAQLDGVQGEGATMLERASPVQLRKALELANLFVKMGVNFVPVPVASDEEQAELVAQAMAKLEVMEQQAEGSESNG